MPCYHPMRAYQAYAGAQPKILRGNDFTSAWNMKVPCAKCIGCRLDRSKQWAIRLMHEAQHHEKNSFITLTYNNETLKGWGEFEDSPPTPHSLLAHPQEAASMPNYSTDTRALNEIKATHADCLSKRHAQLFLKRLRKALAKQNPLSKVKYYLVGEYGDRTNRPHYHAAIFGEDFSDDRYAWRSTGAGHHLYRSSRLESAWGKGHCEISELTFESAAYIARYIMKKIDGPRAEQHYQRHDLTTGEVYTVTPEFALMSRGGKTGRGIGHAWFENYHSDVYPHDYVVMKGKKLKPPRYYDNLLAAVDREAATLLKLERKFAAEHASEDNTPRRLRDKELVTQSLVNLKKRPLE